MVMYERAMVCFSRAPARYVKQQFLDPYWQNHRFRCYMQPLQCLKFVENCLQLEIIICFRLLKWIIMVQIHYFFDI
jgi:hypothetical protein